MLWFACTPAPPAATPAVDPDRASAPPSSAPDAAPDPAPAVAADVPATQVDRVKAAIRKQSTGVRSCYERQLESEPRLEGRLEVGWVAHAGVVSDVRVLSDTIGSPELAACVTAEIARWSFPADIDGDVTWPFVFRPDAPTR